ncbi:MAG: hypothetical protein AAFQ16_04605 [Pseudomonadota bacterium]
MTDTQVMYRCIAISASFALLSGCASTVTYSPVCAAYSGDRIAVNGDRFTWDRFTDTRRVDNKGNEIDANPGYPRTGTIEIDDTMMRFVDESGAVVGTFVSFEDDGDRYLLTQEDHAAVAGGDAVPDCALQQEGAPGN